MAKMLELSSSVYGRLLALCPREFRRRFGAEMMGVFEDLLCDALRQGGLAGLASLSCSAYWDVITVAVLTRLRNTAVIAGGLSLVVSAALFLALFRAVS
jgi:hypothetical protein